jgi:hypothetical protein
LQKIKSQRLQNQHIEYSQMQTPVELLSSLGAIQGQDYQGAKWSLGLRLAKTTDEQIEQAIADNKIVRTWLMRGTLFLTAASDVRWILDIVAERLLANSQRRYRELELDEATFAASDVILFEALKDAKQLIHVGRRDAIGEYLARSRGHLKIDQSAVAVEAYVFRLHSCHLSIPRITNHEVSLHPGPYCPDRLKAEAARPLNHTGYGLTVESITPPLNNTFAAFWPRPSTESLVLSAPYGRNCCMPAETAPTSGLAGKVDQQALGTQVGLLGIAPKILANTGMLEAAGRNGEAPAAAVAVDPDGSRLELVHQPHRPVQIGRMHTCRQAV